VLRGVRRWRVCALLMHTRTQPGMLCAWRVC
jgi:hypothetical protein